MPKRRYASDDISHKCREADALLGQRNAISEAWKVSSASPTTPTSAGASSTAGSRSTRPSGSRICVSSPVKWAVHSQTPLGWWGSPDS